MKDIDFEELDRAVSSHMNKGPKPKPSVTTSTPPAPVKAVPLAAASTQKPVTTVVSQPARPAMPPRAITTAPSPKGRFMDMVRPAPARDETIAPPSASIPRQAAAVQPVRLQPPVASSARTSESPPKPLSDISPSAQTVRPNQSARLEPVALSGSEPTPLVSPFLKDAKVEKRPLGRTADAGGWSEPLSEPYDHEIDLISETETDLQASPPSSRDAQVPEQPLPAELNSELLSIEMNDGDGDGNGADLHEASLSHVRTASVSHLAAPDEAGRLAASPAPRQAIPAVQTELEAPGGSVYDTAAYHQPLAHPAKKQPGWMYVAVTVLILLLGAAGGAALYYLLLSGARS